MRATMVDTQVIRDAVRLACRAPSLHNSQPWRWVVEGATVQLFVEPDQVVRGTDRSGREALIGCGAVLDHFRVAMAAAGLTANVDRFPNPNNLLHVASIDFSPMEFVTEATVSARTRSCCDAPIVSHSPLRPTGIRSSRSCATPLTPTPYAST